MGRDQGITIRRAVQIGIESIPGRRPREVPADALLAYLTTFVIEYAKGRQVLFEPRDVAAEINETIKEILMGEPAVPTEQERRARRALAHAFVEASACDEASPLRQLLRAADEEDAFVGMETSEDIETMLFGLAQELVLDQADGINPGNLVARIGELKARVLELERENAELRKRPSGPSHAEHVAEVAAFIRDGGR